jgi:DNA-directed RNA polymerase subunit K/omega
MNDFERAAKNIGNRFDMVLIASERVRELHRTLREKDEENKKLGIIDTKSRILKTPPGVQAITDIETKLVGREYLNKVKSREKRKKPRFDEL